MSMVPPNNLPAWAKTGLQWAVIGGALVYGYTDIRADMRDFKTLAVNMDANLVSINKRISNLDVTEDRIIRLQADVKELQDWRRNMLAREPR